MNQTENTNESEPIKYMDYACGHCKGFGIHDNNVQHICIACHRTGLLPLSPNFPLTSVLPSRKSKEHYQQSLSTIGLSPFQINNKQFRVIIAGCGIAGAAVTLSLQQRNINVTCYERDQHFNYRAQGYGLTLQQGSVAMNLLGIDCSHNNVAYAITKHNSFSADGEVLGSYGSLDVTKLTTETVKKASKHNIVITRQDLRQKLIDKLKPNTIQWGISVIGYTSQPNSLLTVYLSNGECITDCSLLIGCEGIRSITRLQKLQILNPLRFLKVFVILGISQLYPSKPTNNQSNTNNTITNNNTDTTNNDIQLDNMTTISQQEQSTTHPTTSTTSTTSPTETTLPIVSKEEEYQQMQLEHIKQYSCVNQASDGCTRIYSMPFDENTIMWQLSFPLESQQAGIELQMTGQKGLLDESKRRCLPWALKYIKPLLLNTPEHTVTGYPAYDRNIPSLESLRNGFVTKPIPNQDELKLIQIDDNNNIEYGLSEAPFSQNICIQSRNNNSNITTTSCPDDDIQLQQHNNQQPESSNLATISSLPTQSQSSTLNDNIQDQNCDMTPPFTKFPLSITANKRVTLLGDAMHPCSPFKAQGANQALLDAVYLSRAITTLLINSDERKIQLQHELDTLKQQLQQDDNIINDEQQIHTDENNHQNNEQLQILIKQKQDELNQYQQPTLDELDQMLLKFEHEMIIRTTPKVYDSRNNIALLHSESTLAKGDLPRAYVAKLAQDNSPSPCNDQ